MVIKAPSERSFRFDWITPFTDTFLHELAVEVTSVIEQNSNARGLSSFRRQRRREEWLHISELLLSALYRAYWSIPKSVVSVPGSESAYKLGDPQKIQYSFTFTQDVKNLLLERHWIDEERGVEATARTTRIWATGELLEIFRAEGFSWKPQVLKDRNELVVLRDLDPNSENRKKKIDILVPESSEVSIYRDNLFAINSFIAEHCVAFNLDDDQLSLIFENGSELEEESVEWVEDKPKFIDFYNTQLRRIFSRGSMELGGRFYNGWWQLIPEEHRAHITINGYPTSEIDYSAIGFRILYQQEDIEYDLESDPYDIGLANWLGKRDPRRKLIKKYLNAILNDFENNYHLSVEQQNQLRISHSELDELCRAKHEPIAQKFGTGVGLETQFVDSKIAESVILKMMERGVIVLPIHDSFIVRTAHLRDLREVMEASYSQVVGGAITTTLDKHKPKDFFGMDKETIQELIDSSEEDFGVYNVTSLKDEILTHNPSLMDSFVEGWREWLETQGL